MVDSLRAVAALAVVAVHVEDAIARHHHLSNTVAGDPLRVAMAHLAVGVPIFFVISGFVLYRPFLAGRRGQAPAVRLGVYARRRALRILPGYWVALTILAVVPGLADVFTHDFWLRYGLLAQILPAQHLDCGPTGLCGLAPTWSLSVEMGFYAMLPACVVALGWWTGRGGRQWYRLELAGLATMAGLSMLLYAFGAGGPTADLAHSPLGFFSWFVGGMVLAAVSVRRAERMAGQPDAHNLSVPAWVGWAGAAVAFALYCALVPLDGITGTAAADRAAVMVLSGAIGVLVVLPAISVTTRGAVHRLLLSRPLRAMGLISYGIFLYHYPIVFGLERIGADSWLHVGGSFEARALTLTILALPLAIAAATFSYYVVERPFLGLRRRRRAARPINVVAVAPAQL
jgi:peptidoglycan/LPS O-acetylase OafA/YrhL